MMTKTVLRMSIIALVAMMGLAAGPVEKTRILRVVMVMEGHNLRLQPQINGLHDGLEELKYIEGENLNVRQVNGGTSDELRANLKSLLPVRQFDIIVPLRTSGTAVPRERAPGIPMVFLPAPHPA